MAVYSPTADTHTLAALRADLNQLRNPIPRPAHRQRIRSPGGGRYTKWSQPPALDPLLVLLRHAADGQHSTMRGPERRSKPGSRPPGSLDAMDLLARVTVGIAGWHNGLNLPSPPRDTDWQLHALGQIHDEARRWTPDTVTAVAQDVHDWWRWAAAASGLAQHELHDMRNL